MYQNDTVSHPKPTVCSDENSSLLDYALCGIGHPQLNAMTQQKTRPMGRGLDDPTDTTDSAVLYDTLLPVFSVCLTASCTALYCAVLSAYIRTYVVRGTLYKRFPSTTLLKELFDRLLFRLDRPRRL